MADEELTSQDSGTLSESVSVLVIAGAEASYAAESVLGTVPSSDTSNVSESDMNVLTDYSYHNLDENEIVHHDIEEDARFLSSYILVVRTDEGLSFDERYSQSIVVQDGASLSDGHTNSIVETDTPTLVDQYALSLTNDDAASGSETVYQNLGSSDTAALSEVHVIGLDTGDDSHSYEYQQIGLQLSDAGFGTAATTQSFASDDASVLSETYSMTVQEDETSVLTESSTGTRLSDDTASLVSVSSIEQGYQDSAILSEITNREASYIEFGFVSYKTLVLHDESDTSLRIIESPLMLHRDQDKSEGKSDQIVSMNEGDLLSLRCYHTYLERHIYDRATFVSGIYYGTIFSKFGFDAGRLRTFGSLMIARILGAVPGATIYHETLNMLARMIEIMKASVLDTFFVPFKEIGEGQEKWRGGNQMQQTGTFVDNVIAITTSSTDFAALIEQYNLQKM